MAYVHEQPSSGQPGRDPVQASALAEIYTTTEGAGLPPRRRYRRPLVLALAATVVFGGGGVAAASTWHGKGSGEGNPGNGKGGAAGGLAPATSPSRRGAAPGVAGTRSALPSPAVSKSAKPGTTVALGTHGSSARPEGNKNVKFDCTGLDVSRNGSTLHVKPQVTKQGHPDSSKFVTVADYFHGRTPASDPNNHHVYSAVGFGSAVDVAVPADLNWKDDAATVFVAYYPDGNIPTDPNKLSVEAGGAGRVAAACGNAVVTWAVQTGQTGGLGKPG